MNVFFVRSEDLDRLTSTYKNSTQEFLIGGFITVQQEQLIGSVDDITRIKEGMFYITFAT